MMLDGTSQEQSAKNLDSFFERISRLAEVNPDDLLKDQNELMTLIQPIVLQKIYQYILNNKEQIQKELLAHNAYRLPKEISELSRTINIIQGDENDWILLLETKLKLASGIKDKNRPVYSGSFKKGKDAWRIDNFSPEKWVNMVVKSGKEQELAVAVLEAKYSQEIAKRQNPKGDTTPLFNRSYLGARFDKKGKVKQSLYSPKAIGSLDKMDIKILTQKDKDRIAKGILEGLAFIHSRKEVSQDVRPNNVLIYQDEHGYYAKLTDFGSCTGVIKDIAAQATAQYESPEISFASRAFKDVYFRKYYQRHASYGRAVSKNRYPEEKKKKEKNTENIALAKSFCEPHAKNDMWAAGVLLYELFTGDMLTQIGPESAANIMSNPLLTGLLEPDREKRLTAEDALAIMQLGTVEASTTKRRLK